jgi:hypothetical protein
MDARLSHLVRVLRQRRCARRYLMLLSALFVTVRFPPWRMTLLIVAIDCLWPYVAMLSAGASLQELHMTLRGSLAAA